MKKSLRFNKQTELKFLERLDKRTIQTYKPWLQQLYEFNDFNNLRDVNFDKIKSFFYYLENDKDYSPSSLYIAFNAVKFLYLEIYSIKHSFEKIKLPRIEREIPISISKKDLKLIFESIVIP